MPFSHVEVLARIAKADEERGVQLINTCLTAPRVPRYRELLGQFHDVRENAPQVSSVAAGQRAARQFETLCYEFLVRTSASKLPYFSGEEGAKIVRWSGIPFR